MDFRKLVRLMRRQTTHEHILPKDIDIFVSTNCYGLSRHGYEIHIDPDNSQGHVFYDKVRNQIVHGFSVTETFKSGEAIHLLPHHGSFENNVLLKRRRETFEVYAKILDLFAYVFLSPKMAEGFIGDLNEQDAKEIFPKYGKYAPLVAAVVRTIKIGGLILRLLPSQALRIFGLAKIIEKIWG